MKFRRIDQKILAVIGGCVLLALTLLSWFYAQREERGILAQNLRTLIKVNESALRGLDVLMLSGYGDAGPEFARRLAGIPDLSDLRVLRTDGNQAFLDNAEIERANARLGFAKFNLRDEERSLRVLPEDLPELVAARRGDTVHWIGTAADGHREITLLTPIPFQPACARCHEDTGAPLGVLKLTSSLAGVDAAVAATRRHSLVLLAINMVLTLLLTGVLVRRSVVRPIKAMSEAIVRAERGDLSQEVPSQGHAELHHMAESFNTMIRQLGATYSGLEEERNKLTTVILGAAEGMVATDAEDRVVLVNPAAERLLGMTEASVRERGLHRLLDREDLVRSLLAQGTERGPRTELTRHQGRIFAVRAGRIHDDDGRYMGSALLLRDVSAEVTLREELRRQSETDALTGLYNRRYFDQRLAHELALAARYNPPLSLLLFDVDHFKRFNDTYGHDMGDRVLQAVANTALRCVRSVDVVCRYGGEEFVVIMPGADAHVAGQTAEALRLGVAACGVDGLSVTISVGIAPRPPLQTSHAATLLKAADLALYDAKRSGRNCCRARITAPPETSA